MKEKEFKEIFETLYPKVYGFALKAVGQQWLAEEIAHTAFCKFWTHRDNLDLEGKEYHDKISLVSGYLFVISRNEVNNYFRECTQIAEYRNSFAEHICTEARVEQRIDAKDALIIIDRAVQAMPKIRREVFSLSRFHHYTNKEIAKKLNISRRTVEKHMELALSQLKLELLSYQA